MMYYVGVCNEMSNMKRLYEILLEEAEIETEIKKETETENE